MARTVVSRMIAAEQQATVTKPAHAVMVFLLLTTPYFLLQCSIHLNPPPLVAEYDAFVH